MEENKIINLSIPVKYSFDGEYYGVSTTDESKDKLGAHLHGYGHSIEEAEEKFWSLLKWINTRDKKRSKELNKYKFFQKGDWSAVGGKWFTILGINFFFRKQKGNFPMEGGWIIPFTKQNIRIHNHWIEKHK